MGGGGQNMRLVPEEMRAAASDIGRLSDEARQVEEHLRRSWRRLDYGWQSYARENVEGHFNQVLDDVRRLSLALNQIKVALATTSRRLAESDQLAARSFVNQEGEASVGESSNPRLDLDDPGFSEVDGINANYGLVEGELFVKGSGDNDAIHPSDIDQNQLGDCYLMAALGALARTEKGRKAIRQMIRSNGDGTYTVRFYDGSDSVEVVVDSELPLRNGNPVFAGTGEKGDSPELWVALVEKAYAEYKGDDYGDIEGGDPGKAMEELVGVQSDRISTGLFGGLTVEKLSEQVENGAVTASSLHNYEMDSLLGTINIPDKSDMHSLYKSDTLIAGHAYYIENVDSVNETVTVRNPHGPHCDPIVLDFDDFKATFRNVSVNPIE